MKDFTSIKINILVLAGNLTPTLQNIHQSVKIQRCSEKEKLK